MKLQMRIIVSVQLLLKSNSARLCASTGKENREVLIENMGLNHKREKMLSSIVIRMYIMVQNCCKEIAGKKIKLLSNG